MRRVGCWPSHSCWKARRGLTRHAPAAWIGSRCGLNACVQGVHRYNEDGLPGLSNRQGAVGPKPRLTAEQEAEVTALVRNGPDLAEHGVVRWRRVDLAAVIAERFDVTLAERTVGTLLRRLGFVRLSVRPRHPAHDAGAQSAHKKTSPRWSRRRSRNELAASRSNSGGKMRPASASKAP